MTPDETRKNENLCIDCAQLEATCPNCEEESVTDETQNERSEITRKTAGECWVDLRLLGVNGPLIDVTLYIDTIEKRIKEAVQAERARTLEMIEKRIRSHTRPGPRLEAELIAAAIRGQGK